MKINELLKQLQHESNMTQTQIAGALGLKQHTVSQNISNPNPKMETVLTLIELLGYELIVQPRSSGRRPEGQMRITK